MIEIDVFEITQKGMGQSVESVHFFLGALPTSWVTKHADIDRWGKDNRDGYQRPAEQSRIKLEKGSAVRYLLEEIGTFPTSVLLNIREPLILNMESELFKNIKKGKIKIPDESTLWIIDGQHRIEALKMALVTRPELSDYPIPVSILNLKTKFDEMLLFYIVNSRQKKIPVNVAYRHLQSMVEKMKITGKYEWIKEAIVGPKQEREAIAALVVDFLDDEDNSPYKNHIKYLGDAWEPSHLIEDSVLIRYISKILSEKSFELMSPIDFAQILVMYWNAIKELYPNAFEEEQKDNYTILKHTGVASFTYLFTSIYGICAREANITQDRMLELLGYLSNNVQSAELLPDFQKPMDEKWWSRTSGPAIAKATSESTFSLISQQMAKKINIIMKSKAATP